MYPLRLDENYITSQLVGAEHKKNWEIENHDSFRQLSLFDDYRVTAPVTADDTLSVLTGTL